MTREEATNLVPLAWKAAGSTPEGIVESLVWLGLLKLDSEKNLDRWTGPEATTAELCKELVTTMDGWQSIITAPQGDGDSLGPWLILAHKEWKWIRFGRYYPQCRRWYYSEHNGRAQWAQVENDEPTHWMPMPSLP